MRTSRTRRATAAAHAGSAAIAVSDQLQALITFQTDDRWSAEVHDITAAGDPLIASYTFQRSPR